jgi:hypothetical protein
LTRMPSRLASIARARENMMMAAMLAPRTVSPGVAVFPASEAILMMLPPR